MDVAEDCHRELRHVWISCAASVQQASDNLFPFLIHKHLPDQEVDFIVS